MRTIELTGYRQCEQALKSADLEQALYDEGGIVMDRVLVTLHGDEHHKRRLTEMGVFRRDFFRRYEREVIPMIFQQVMSSIDKSGDVDLVDLHYRFMVNLSINFAGVDRADGSASEFEDLIRLLRLFGVAATLGQNKGDREALRLQARAGLAEFDERFFTPSAERRKSLVAKMRAGDICEDELPMDVLTVLLKNQDDLSMARDMMLRETAFYFLASAHTSVHSLSHAVHHLLDWFDQHPADRARFVADPGRVQRFVHESFRLHPASPIALRRARAPVDFGGGARAEAGDMVRISLREANRDPDIFGNDAARFNPRREVPPGVPATGVTFGIGMHSCLGKNLAAGALTPAGLETTQLGTVSWIAHALLCAGVTRDPNRPGQRDETIERETWQTYPVQFVAHHSP